MVSFPSRRVCLTGGVFLAPATVWIRLEWRRGVKRYTFPPARTNFDDPNEAHVLPPLPAEDDDLRCKPQPRPRNRKNEPETLAELAGIVKHNARAKEANDEAPRRFKPLPIASRLKPTPSAMWGLLLTLTLLLV